MTLIVNFIVGGLFNRDYLFLRVRHVILGMPLWSWVIGVGGAAATAFWLYSVGWVVTWLIFGVIGVALALAYQLTVIGPLRIQKHSLVHEAREIAKGLRSLGLSE